MADQLNPAFFPNCASYLDASFLYEWPVDFWLSDHPHHLDVRRFLIKAKERWDQAHPKRVGESSHVNPYPVQTKVTLTHKIDPETGLAELLLHGQWDMTVGDLLAGTAIIPPRSVEFTCGVLTFVQQLRKIIPGDCEWGVLYSSIVDVGPGTQL